MILLCKCVIFRFHVNFPGFFSINQVPYEFKSGVSFLPDEFLLMTIDHFIAALFHHNPARREQHRPTLIAVHSQIAYGAPQQGKCCAHGAPLGEAEAGHGGVSFRMPK